MLHPAIIGVDKDYRVLESRHGQCHHFWAEQLRSLETVDEVWEQVAGTRFDAIFPGVILRLSINPLGQSGTVGYRITIHDDQGDDRGCHIKVGWALEGAYHHPGIWDAAGWSIGGRATLVHGGDADPSSGRMGYRGSTSMFVDGRVQPAKFAKGDTVETFCTRSGDVIYMSYFVNGRRVHRGKNGQGCSPHAFKVDDAFGGCLMPAIAGGINFGSWWVSLELLCQAQLPSPPLEVMPPHWISVVEPRPTRQRACGAMQWKCDECNLISEGRFHGCSSCGIWICDACHWRPCWVSTAGREFRRAGSMWIEFAEDRIMNSWKCISPDCWPADLQRWQIRKGIPAARDDAGKEWQEVSTQSVQTDDAKGDVRSFGSQDILSNGNGMRYLQKRRKEEEGTEGI